LKPIGARSQAALREAMARLVAGRPRVTDGRLTVVNLAREAGVGRATANRAVDVLAEFHRAAARVPRRRNPSGDVATVRSRDAAEIAMLKGMINQLAQQVQQLALRGAEQNRTIDTLRAALAEATAGRVIPFRPANQ
jgi:hypothetical protein